MLLVQYVAGRQAGLLAKVDAGAAHPLLGMPPGVGRRRKISLDERRGCCSSGCWGRVENLLAAAPAKLKGVYLRVQSFVVCRLTYQASKGRTSYACSAIVHWGLVPQDLQEASLLPVQEKYEISRTLNPKP